MSFICSSEKKYKEYNNKFEKCGKTFCKLAISNKACLFHPNEKDVKIKPFCNNTIKDFYLLYLLTPSMEKTMERTNNNANYIIDSFKIPYNTNIKNRATFLMDLNKRNQKWKDGVLKTFNQNTEMLDIDKIIDSTQTKSEYVIHSVKEITYKKKKYNVSIECVVGNAVGIYFLSKNDLFN